jgi:cell division protein FtsI/penicillin-binding protein 2
MVLLVGFLLLIAQLVRWQVLDRDRVLPPQASAAAEPKKRGPQRGTVVERHGQPLALDTYRWEIWAQPSLVDPEQAPELTSKLVQTLGPELSMAPSELLQLLSSGDARTYTLARRAPELAGEAIRAWTGGERRGIGMRPYPIRFYPQRALAAHILGFVNDEPNAYYGIEEHYDDYLRQLGTPFQKTDPSVQALYRQLPVEWQEYLPSDTGQDMVLTIDLRAQFMVERALAKALGKYQAEAGTIIVLDPHTGAILAMASLPSYDPNRFGTTSTDKVLVDPAISKQYEPGSVFKVVTMAAGIDAGLITPDTVITDTVAFEYFGQAIQNWDRQSKGPITVREVLIGSRNVPTAKVAVALGDSLFYQYVRRFGFGQLTEVDLANEAPGTVKVPGDPFWSPFDLATNSFGQALAATPLQVAVATSVIANGGVLVRPHILEAMVYRGQVIRPETTVVRRVIKPETAAAMRDIMVDVVAVGSANAKVSGYAVAGKSGTAQVAIEGGYSATETIHTFVGFAPADSPQVVVLVKLDKPKSHPWAESTAAPTFAEVIRQMMILLNVAPEQVAGQP